MGQGAAKDMLVAFLIGADDGQCHKNPIVMIIATSKRFSNVVHCSETGVLPTWTLALTAHFKTSLKRQPNSFNCWIPLC